MGMLDKYRAEVREEIDFKEEQERLHKENQDIAEETVIIEKDTTTKYVLAFIKAFCKTLFGIAFIVLATVGLLTLIYPETRGEMITVINNIIGDLKNLVM